MQSQKENMIIRGEHSVPKAAVSFYVTCMLSHVQLFANPWTVARQASLSMGFSRQEYWSGLPFPSPGDLPDSGMEPTSPMSPALQSNSLPLSHLGNSWPLSSPSLRGLSGWCTWEKTEFLSLPIALGGESPGLPGECMSSDVPLEWVGWISNPSWDWINLPHNSSWSMRKPTIEFIHEYCHLS